MAAFVADAITFNTTAGNKTVAITPAIGELLVVVVANTGTTTDPTVTDDRSGTYTRIGGCAKATSADEMHVYVRDQLVQAAVSHTLTMNVGGAGTGGGITVIRVSGMTKFGSGAVRQIASQSNQGAAGTPTLTFPVPTLTENMVVGAVFNATNPATMTAPGSFSERSDVGYATPTTGLETVTRDSGHTSETVTWGGTSASAFCSIGIELDIGSPTAVWGPGSRRPHFTRLRRLPFPDEHPFYPAPAQAYTLEVGGSLGPAGGLVNAIGQALAGAITPAGALLKGPTLVLSGATTPVGTLDAVLYSPTFLQRSHYPGIPYEILRRRPVRPAAGEAAAAQAYTLEVSGALTPAGGLVNAAAKIFAASTTPAGGLVKAIASVRGGALTPAGGLANQAGKVLGGSTTPTGALTRGAGTIFAGSITPSGQPANAAGKIVAGGDTPAGGITKAVSKIFGGGDTPTGALGLVRTVLLALAGTVTPTGVISNLVGKITSGADTPTGALAKGVAKSTAGALEPTGQGSSSAGKALAGAVTPAGSSTSSVGKALAGGATPAGAIANAVSKILGGGVTPSGALGLVQTLVQHLSVGGALTPIGSLVRAVSKAAGGSATPTGQPTSSVSKGLAGEVAPTGTLANAKALVLALAGSLTPGGTLTRAVGKALAGGLTPSGSLTRAVSKILAGGVTPSGALTPTFFGTLVRACVSMTIRPFAAVAASERAHGAAELALRAAARVSSAARRQSSAETFERAVAETDVSTIDCD